MSKLKKYCPIMLVSICILSNELKLPQRTQYKIQDSCSNDKIGNMSVNVKLYVASKLRTKNRIVDNRYYLHSFKVQKML